MLILVVNRQYYFYYFFNSIFILQTIGNILLIKQHKKSNIYAFIINVEKLFFFDYLR